MNMEPIDLEKVKSQAQNNRQPTCWVICASGHQYQVDLIRDKLGQLETFAAICQKELCDIKNLSVNDGREPYPAEMKKLKILTYVLATVEREVIDRRKRIGRRRARFLADFFEKAGRVISDEQYVQILSAIEPQYIQDMAADDEEWEEIKADRSLHVDPPEDTPTGKTVDTSKTKIMKSDYRQGTGPEAQVIRRRKVALCRSRPGSSQPTPSSEQ